MWVLLVAFNLLPNAVPTDFRSCVVEASQDGYDHLSPFGGAWSLKVDPRGEGRLVVRDARAEGVTAVRALDDRRQLDAALADADFMHLVAAPYVSLVEHADDRVITVRCGDELHTVTLGETPDDSAASADPREVEHFSRALRVWIAVRSVFVDAGAADTREGDRAFLARRAR
jgi:hypothetical protein